MSQLEIRIFILILLAVVLPLSIITAYYAVSYEKLIKDEMSASLVRIVSQSKYDLESLYEQMVNISNTFSRDESFRTVLQDSQASYYEKTLVFDSMVDNYFINEPKLADYLKITVIDNNGQIFANWSMNFNDYSFVTAEDFVKESQSHANHIVWGGVMPSFIYEEGDRKYITLARSMTVNDRANTYLSTLILSLDQQYFDKVITRYFSDAQDFALLRTQEGEVLLTIGQAPAGLPDVQMMKDSLTQSQVSEIGDSTYIISATALTDAWLFTDKPLVLQYFINYQGIAGQVNTIYMRIRLSLLFLFLAIFFVVIYLSRYISKPMRMLADKIRDYTVDTLPQGLDLQRNDEIGQISRAFLSMAKNNRTLFYRLKHESLQKEQYYFASIRAQVNPHFLFNTLTTIRWMAIIKKADNIVDALDALAGILKYSMDKGKEYVTLEEELQSINRYVSLQNYHYGSKYVLYENIDVDLMQYEVIKFILQPIVENAVVHAFKKKTRNCIITLSGHVEDEKLILFVSDNGSGMAPEAIERFTGQKQTSHVKKVEKNGIGLENVDERIRIQFGQEYGISISSVEGQGTTVTYVLPLISSEEDKTAGE